MIDVVSGDLSKDKDWAKVWLESKHRAARYQELEELNSAVDSRPISTEEDAFEYAAPFSEQMKIVVERAFVQLWRDTEYIINKVALHISVGLLVGFSFWKIGNSYADLQNRLFAIFNFIFVARECSLACLSLTISRCDGPDPAEVYRQSRHLREAGKEGQALLLEGLLCR